MRYASIRKMDISNGEGIGVALFVQGCHFHCKNCFNPDTWDFSGGKEWTSQTQEEFLHLTLQPYITRISILGGEPLAEENVEDLLELISTIRTLDPVKPIWIYTGYTWEELKPETDDSDGVNKKRAAIIQQCNILVDGRYIDDQRDLTLKWRGSRNQRVIDIQSSLLEDKIVLYE